MFDGRSKILASFQQVPADIQVRQLGRTVGEHFEKIVDDLEARWCDFVIKAESEGRKVWNSSIYRLDALHQSQAGVQLDLSTIETKEVLTLGPLIRALGLGETYWPKNIFVGSLLHTSDDFFAFGRRSGITLGNRDIDLIGGAMTEDEGEVSCGGDIGRALLREFSEEIGLEADRVDSLTAIGAILTPVQSVGLIFLARVELSAVELKAAFNIGNDGELKDIDFVEGVALPSFLSAQPSYLPLVWKLYEEFLSGGGRGSKATPGKRAASMRSGRTISKRKAT